MKWPAAREVKTIGVGRDPHQLGVADELQVSAFARGDLAALGLEELAGSLPTCPGRLTAGPFSSGFLSAISAMLRPSNRGRPGITSGSWIDLAMVDEVDEDRAKVNKRRASATAIER